MSGRVFGIFPPHPPFPTHPLQRGYCLRSLECAEGACIVRRPSYMHHPPSPPPGANPPLPSTLYLHSLFFAVPLVLALVLLLQFLLRVHAHTTSHPFVYIVYDGRDKLQRLWQGDARRTGRKEVRGFSRTKGVYRLCRGGRRMF